MKGLARIPCHFVVEQDLVHSSRPLAVVQYCRLVNYYFYSNAMRLGRRQSGDIRIYKPMLFGLLYNILEAFGMAYMRVHSCQQRWCQFMAANAENRMRTKLRVRDFQTTKRHFIGAFFNIYLDYNTFTFIRLFFIRM